MFAGVSSALISEGLNDGRSRQPSGISELKHSIFPLVLAHIGKKPLKLLGDQTPIRLAQRNHHDAKMGGIDIRKSVEEITVRRDDHSTRFNRFSAITASLAPSNPITRKSITSCPFSSRKAVTLLGKFSSSKNFTPRPRSWIFGIHLRPSRIPERRQCPLS